MNKKSQARLKYGLIFGIVLVISLIYMVTFVSAGNILTILDPLNISPVSVSSLDNLTIIFNFTENEVVVTSGISINNITIGGVQADIIEILAESNWTSRTCSGVWGASCVGEDPGVGDYSYDACAVTSYHSSDFYVNEVSVNATELKIGETINITCNYDCHASSNLNDLAISYYNGIDWTQVWSQDTECVDGDYSVNVVINGLVGEQYARCSIGYSDFNPTGTCFDTNYADNDDVNFTVVGSTQEFSYVATGWNVNVTVPTFVNGLKDLILNITYSVINYIDTQINVINYGDDTIFPDFSEYYDDNATLEDTGTGHFNVTVENTNGTVFLWINNTKIYATNLSADNYNVSFTFTQGKNYMYNWTAYGNGTNNNKNISGNFWYTVNISDSTYPIFSDYDDDNASIEGIGTGHFNVTVANTNGTVILHINNTDIYATNLSADNYNVSFAFTQNGSYMYNWTAYGNGTNNNKNISGNFWYTVNASVSCGNLNIENKVYTLTNNVTSADTCFEIVANNITLDCAGYTINFSSDTGNNEYAVTSNNFNYTTIKNCNILQGNNNSEYQTALYLASSFNHNIINNTINIFGAWSNAILINFGGNHSFSNNTIITIKDDAIAFILFETNYINISNNVIDTSGYDGNPISMTDSNNSIIDNNVITDSGFQTFAIYLKSGSYFNTFSNNLISTSNQHGYGFYFGTSGKNIIKNNVITTTGLSGYGIKISTRSHNNIFSNNTITTSAVTAHGIYLESHTNNNSFSNMYIKTSNTGNAFRIQDTSHNLTVKDSIFNCSNAAIQELFIRYAAGTWNFTNVTRANSLQPLTVSWQDWDVAGRTLNMHWYLDVNVSNSTFSSLQNANVTGSNINGVDSFSELTGADGLITTQTLLEYTRNNSNTIYYTPHTIGVSLSDYTTNSTSVNISSTLNTWLNVNLYDDTVNPTWSTNLTNLTTITLVGESVYFNITLSDDNPDSYIFRWYNGTNWTNTTGSYTDGEEISIIKTINIDVAAINWTWYFNDTNNNLNQTDIWSIVLVADDSTPPNISIVYPLNNTTHNINMLNVNYTRADPNLDSCWYTRDSGVTNYTLTGCTNITTVNWGEGTHNVRIYVNDTLGNENSTSVTFTIAFVTGGQTGGNGGTTIIDDDEEEIEEEPEEEIEEETTIIEDIKEVIKTPTKESFISLIVNNLLAWLILLGVIIYIICIIIEKKDKKEGKKW